MRLGGIPLSLSIHHSTITGRPLDADNLDCCISSVFFVSFVVKGFSVELLAASEVAGRDCLPRNW